MTRFRFRLPAAAATATVAGLLIAAPAFAHIHADPAEVQGGTEATVGFTVEHGCKTSPTTELEIQMPDGFTAIKGIDVAGFTATVKGQVVTFAGGTLPDGTEQAFQVSFTAPDEPGEVPVKIIQTCEEGSTNWIEVQADGQAEPEHPAPVLTITEGAPTENGGGHGHDEATATTEADHDHAEEKTSTTLEEHGHDEAAADSDDDSSSSAPVIAGAVVAVAVIGGGGYAIARSRKNSSGTPDPEA
jgi:uncharacterized protein YcnI